MQYLNATKNCIQHFPVNIKFYEVSLNCAKMFALKCVKLLNSCRSANYSYRITQNSQYINSAQLTMDTAIFYTGTLSFAHMRVINTSKMEIQKISMN